MGMKRNGNILVPKHKMMTEIPATNSLMLFPNGHSSE